MAQEGVGVNFLEHFVETFGMRKYDLYIHLQDHYHEATTTFLRVSDSNVTIMYKLHQGIAIVFLPQGRLLPDQTSFTVAFLMN